MTVIICKDARVNFSGPRHTNLNSPGRFTRVHSVIVIRRGNYTWPHERGLAVNGCRGSVQVKILATISSVRSSRRRKFDSPHLLSFHYGLQTYSTLR